MKTKSNGGAMPDFMGRWWFLPLAIVWMIGSWIVNGIKGLGK